MTIHNIYSFLFTIVKIICIIICCLYCIFVLAKSVKGNMWFMNKPIVAALQI